MGRLEWSFYNYDRCEPDFPFVFTLTLAAESLAPDGIFRSGWPGSDGIILQTCCADTYVYPGTSSCSEIMRLDGANNTAASFVDHSSLDVVIPFGGRSGYGCNALFLPEGCSDYVIVLQIGITEQKRVAWSGC